MPNLKILNNFQKILEVNFDFRLLVSYRHAYDRTFRSEKNLDQKDDPSRKKSLVFQVDNKVYDGDGILINELRRHDFLIPFNLRINRLPSSHNDEDYKEFFIDLLIGGWLTRVNKGSYVQGNYRGISLIWPSIGFKLLNYKLELEFLDNEIDPRFQSDSLKFPN